MHRLILGFGVSGRAVHAFCLQKGDLVSIYDDRLFPEWPALERIDSAIRSPGFPLTHPLVQQIQERGIPLQGEIDFAFSLLSARHDVTLYGVTGSNGKTTTTLLAAHLLRIAGKRARAVGNVGIPLLSCVYEEVDALVVELSSFQLESIVSQPVLSGAVLLNITPNHLDHHPSFAAYAEAKLNIKKLLKEEAPLHVSRAVDEAFSLAATIFDLETISPLSYRDDKFYTHDRQNLSAAVALTGVDEAIVQEGIRTFTKPPHRLEWVRTLRGMTFINDSKATSVDAVTKAVEAVEAPVLLIAGGVDKGGSYAAWAPLFREKVKKLFVIGQAAERIYAELSAVITVERVPSLEVGVKRAVQEAKSGSTILLSPGCSSYDQFANYEQRGETFKEIVKAL